jgi:hypothetical protein
MHHEGHPRTNRCHRKGRIDNFHNTELASGFWQMPFHATPALKTLHSLGQYKWLCLLWACLGAQQSLMEKLMNNISNVIVYMDDLLVHLQSHEQHLMTLELVMQRLEKKII